MNAERKVVWLTSCSHFITHGFMTILPAVLVAIATEHSMSYTYLGTIANIGYFLYGLGAFPAGYLADRFGSKRMLTIGVFGMTVSSLLVGLSIGKVGFAVSYALLGIFASIHHPAGLSFIARRVLIQKGKALGIHGVLGNIGLFVSPLVAGFCMLIFGSWRAAYLLFAAIGVLFFIILYKTTINDEKDLSFAALFRKENKSIISIPNNKSEEVTEIISISKGVSIFPVSLGILFLGSILSGFIFRGSLTFFPALFQQEISFIANNDNAVALSGYLTTAVLSLGLLSSWFGGYINDKIKRPELFPALIFLFAAPALYMISRYSENKLIAASCIFSLVYYAWQPSQNYLIAKYTKKASHGMGFGVNFFLIFGMGSLATAVGGYIMDEYTIDYFYQIMSYIGGFAAIAALGVYVFRKAQIKYGKKA